MALASTALANVAALGAGAALTGPAARGDLATLAAHRATLAERAPDELAGYDAGVELARQVIETGKVINPTEVSES